ncbi:class I SAM-dependent methyltransferase [Natronolimnohabitans sp. A-GB9]|uniref:methyltransferase domain-containing protein n=1 Tax=Natronolimnohabitans sp. A-GB9 TaxID=3069757 RepID=UPI0027AFB00B|nr:class I SAM-dependent methyltransferase [Natronolimnohabitans sp. A-GB9]MDQ2049332.1 class I SAM-dependent methyltransferase [Natronolimnohabitans sp. A-GB9]
MGRTVSPTADLARYAAERAAPAEPTVVVAGCGRADTVAALLEHGIDAYGFDIEVEALDAAAVPRDRLLECDLREPDLVETLRTQFAIDHVDVCYTEQVLSLLSPDDAERVIERLRAADAIGQCVHRIAAVPPVGAQTGEFEATVRSVGEWQAACDPDGEDVWLSTGDQLPTASA